MIQHTFFRLLALPLLAVLLLTHGCASDDPAADHHKPGNDVELHNDVSDFHDTGDFHDTSQPRDTDGLQDIDEPHDAEKPDDDTGTPTETPTQISTRGALFHGTLEAGERKTISLLASQKDTIIIWLRRTENTTWHPSVAIERVDGSGTLVYDNPKANTDAHIPYRDHEILDGFEFYHNGPYNLVLGNVAETPGDFEFSLECLSGPCKDLSTDPEEPKDPEEPTDPQNPEEPTDPQNPEEPTDPQYEGLRDQALLQYLRSQHRHNSLGYDSARDVMFGTIDNHDGQVECIYTGTKITTSGRPNANTMNTEHTWPQSKGAKGEPRRSDLHHLFPSISTVNSRRGNHDFGVVTNATWSESGSKLGKDASGQTRFEPRDVSKGNIARAMFYFSAVYNYRIAADQEAALRVWHIADPVDDAERARNDAVANAQRSRNPFIDNPELVARISDF